LAIALTGATATTAADAKIEATAAAGVRSCGRGQVQE
jgi:hypothetical protein